MTIVSRPRPQRPDGRPVTPRVFAMPVVRELPARGAARRARPAAAARPAPAPRDRKR